ncbi:MAG TPA: hypothetical protein VF575_01310 [Candidatus Saccharimonadales bacterium]|jgi:hypothetical protein
MTDSVPNQINLPLTPDIPEHIVTQLLEKQNSDNEHSLAITQHWRELLLCQPQIARFIGNTALMSGANAEQRQTIAQALVGFSLLIENASMHGMTEQIWNVSDGTEPAAVPQT